MIEKIIEAIGLKTIVPLLVGVAIGAFGSEHIVSFSDNWLYKDRANAMKEEIDQLNNKVKDVENQKTELVKNLENVKSEKDNLSKDLSKIKSEDNNRDGFINHLKNGVSRPCDKEFVVYNLHFDVKRSDQTGIHYQGAPFTFLYNSDYYDGKTILYDNVPIIRNHNDTYTEITLERSNKECRILFKLPSQ